MDNFKLNSAGYHDPTAYQALSAIHHEEKKKALKKLVYICSPYARDIPHNTKRAQGYSRFAVSQNVIPIAPHLLLPQFINESDKVERRMALAMAIVLLTKCSELWYFGNKITEGMSKEISFAKNRGMIVRQFSEKCGEIQNG